jgi:membrane AbrB-like protein
VNLLVTVVCVVLGLLLARRFDVPAASLLFPLFVAVAISLTGVLGSISVPVAVQDVGYALIGLQVGLRFTRASLKAVARLLPLAVATILALVAACAVLGVLLSQATGHSRLDGYLATTPGGLYAVLATAIDSGSDVTFILTVQIIRLFVMLFSAPLLARWLRA